MVIDSVGSLLNGRTPVTLTPGLSVRDAANLLTHHRIGAAPVLSGARLVGIFTERDVLSRVVAEGRDPQTTTVDQVMTHQPITVTPSTSIVKAFDLMVDGVFRHLPVVDGAGAVVGVLSMRDIPAEYRLMHRQWMEWMAGDGSATAISPV